LRIPAWNEASASGSIFATAVKGGLRAMPRRIERSGKNAS
jgi:hypothetical protein